MVDENMGSNKVFEVKVKGENLGIRTRKIYDSP
jgi:hypothetical protein